MVDRDRGCIQWQGTQQSFDELLDAGVPVYAIEEILPDLVLFEAARRSRVVCSVGDFIVSDERGFHVEVDSALAADRIASEAGCFLAAL